MPSSFAHSRYFSLETSCVLLALIACATLASAQTPKTDYELNTPYVCPNGTSYTFTKRTGTGYFSTCYYTVMHNGRLFTKAVSACRQMTGYLRGCKLESTASPAAGAPAEDWHSRPTNPAYLAAMPYVEKVKSTIKGTSPEDTLARQLTVFSYLREMIGRMRDASRPYGSPWTPDEVNINFDYNLATKQILDDYAKTHTPEQTDNLKHLEGHYRFMDDQFYRQWTKALFPMDFLQAYDQAAWGLLAQYNAHVDQERKQAEAQLSRQKAAQQQAAAQGGTGGLPNDANSVAARRCLELGGTQVQCFGNALSDSFFGMLGMKQSDLFPASSFTGPTLTGQFNGGNGINAVFSDTTVGLSNCGKLIIDSRDYTLERRGNQILIHVKNSPAPFSLTMEPDGRLFGPASAEITGKVITGYHRYYEYKRSYRTGQIIPGSGHEIEEPIYSAKTQSCSIGTLMPGAPAPIDPGLLNDVAGAVGAVTGQGSEIANKGQEFLAPGIRMAGVYTSQGGLKAEFATASVVLDCGEAHVRDKYAVERAGSQILIHVQNSPSPFTATLQPDGSLAGPDSVVVAGRIATGMTGDKVNFVPRHATCSVGRLSPGGVAAPSSSPAANTPSEPASASQSPITATPASPVASASPPNSESDATLSVATGFPAGTNPLAGKWILLETERFDDMVRSMGFGPPAGITPGQAWVQLAQALATPHFCDPPRNCHALVSAVAKFAVSRFKMPDTGRGVFPLRVPAGIYYVRCNGPLNKTVIFWDLKVDLKPGANSITLDASNATPIK